MRLIDELNELHDRYRCEIDVAVGADEFAMAERLAQAYEDDAIQLMAERENLTHLLPIRHGAPESALRRLARRLVPHAA